MKQLNFSLGGEPFKIDDLVWSQAGIIEALNGLCSSLGTGLSSNAVSHNAFILSGCKITGSNVDTGFIYYNGEIFVVPAHTFTNTPPLYWTIVGTPPLSAGVSTIPTIDTYEDTTTHYTDVLREMQITSGTGTILVSSVPNIRSIIGVVPYQGIIMYSGRVGNFTAGLGNVGSAVEGYALCDGNHGTPNLQGRFIVGYYAGGDPSDADADYGNVNGTGTSVGGQKKHTLLTTELPPHSHNITLEDLGLLVVGTPGVGQTNESGANCVNAGAVTGSTQSTGSGTAHENRPPYYTLAYIQKI